MYKYLSLLFIIVSCASPKEDAQKTEIADSSKQIMKTEIPPVDTNKLNPIALHDTKTVVTPKKEVPVASTKKSTKPPKPVVNPPKPPKTGEVPKIVPVRPPAPPLKNPDIINPPKDENSGKKANLSHQLWDELLRKHVDASGKVNYRGIIADKAKLLEYTSVLYQNPAQPDWDRHKLMAYWINVYNAFTVKLITDKYPVANFNQVGSKPMDMVFIELGMKKYSLNQIGQMIAQFKDARVHFALNGGAKSYPKLLNEAYVPEKLENQLDRQSKDFVNNKHENILTETKVEVSQIFDWYKGEFQEGIIVFLNKYSNVNIKKEAIISYKEFDWSLND